MRVSPGPFFGRYYHSHRHPERRAKESWLSASVVGRNTARFGKASTSAVPSICIDAGFLPAHFLGDTGITEAVEFVDRSAGPPPFGLLNVLFKRLIPNRAAFSGHIHEIRGGNVRQSYRNREDTRRARCHTSRSLWNWDLLPMPSIRSNISLLSLLAVSLHCRV